MDKSQHWYYSYGWSSSFQGCSKNSTSKLIVLRYWTFPFEIVRIRLGLQTTPQPLWAPYLQQINTKRVKSRYKPSIVLGEAPGSATRATSSLSTNQHTNMLTKKSYWAYSLNSPCIASRTSQQTQLLFPWNQNGEMPPPRFGKDLQLTSSPSKDFPICPYTNEKKRLIWLLKD